MTTDPPSVGMPEGDQVGTAGEASDTWELLALPDVAPSGLFPYEPAPQDGPDPTTIVMTEGRFSPSYTFTNGWSIAGGAAWGLLVLGISPWILSGDSWFPDPPGWLLITLAILFVTGAVLLIGGMLRHRARRRSMIRITNEGVSVTSSTGATQRVAWVDIAVLRLFRSTEGDEHQENSLHLRWQHLSTGESVDIVLGEGISARRLDRALRRHAPPAYECLA